MLHTKDTNDKSNTYFPQSILSAGHLRELKVSNAEEKIETMSHA